MPCLLKFEGPPHMTTKNYDKLLALLHVAEEDPQLLADTFTEVCKDDNLSKKIIKAIPQTQNKSPFTELAWFRPVRNSIPVAELVSTDGQSTVEIAHTQPRKRFRSAFSDDDTIQTDAKKPRQESQFTLCLNCNVDFDPASIGESSRHYHPGDNEFAFPEDQSDSGLYRGRDSWGLRLILAERSHWNCCEERLDEDEYSQPCKLGVHRVCGERIDYAIWRGLKDSGVA